MAVMSNVLLDAIYGGVISASLPRMKSHGALHPSTPATSAAWLSELIQALDKVDELPSPRQPEIDACHARLRLPSAPAQVTLH